MNPVRFERLILDLLAAMGYGGGDLNNGRMTRATGDGGIDGVIDEDALGLDAVYVQAKRYDPSYKVGRPDLQRFVGSLTGEGATKGVFVTTSDFSREATGYVERVQHRIKLINGQKLAGLMIQYGVGVRARSTYTIHSVDEDYFVEA
jgi:restriction system protein